MEVRIPLLLSNHPYLTLSQLLKEGGTPVTPPILDSGRRPGPPGHARNMSFPGHPRRDERQPLLRRRSFDEDYDYEPPREEVISTAPIAGGTILGLHNLAIVMPQFIVSSNVPLISNPYINTDIGRTHYECYIQGRR
jgi:solute carrier family 45 protein 1/2/4